MLMETEPCKIEKELGIIRDMDNYKICLNLVSVGNKPPMIDLRQYVAENGKYNPAKGFSFTNDEALTLVGLLDAYLDEKK